MGPRPTEEANAKGTSTDTGGTVCRNQPTATIGGARAVTRCPVCDADLPAVAKFCHDCGTALDNACPHCSADVPEVGDYCPDCGEALESPHGGDRGNVLQVRPREFARRVTDDELKAPGFVNWLRQKKQVKIEAGTRAYLLENGEPVAELGPGKHTIDSLGQKLVDGRRAQQYTTVLVDDGETTVVLSVERLRTATDYPVDATVELTVRVDDAGQLLRNLMADRGQVTAATFDQLLGDAIRDELQATVAEYDPDDLYGNRELKQRLREAIATQCRDLFGRNGIELVALRSFEYDDDRDELRERQKDVEIRADREELNERETELDRQQREREVDETVHKQNQRVRKETAKQDSDHEIERKKLENEHERDDLKRRHEHTADREAVEHDESIQSARKEAEIERRDLEHEQDLAEMEDLVDLKSKKDQRKLDRDEREQDIEMRQTEHEVEMERERLEARDAVDLETLASMEDVDEAVSELAEIEKAADLTPEQLEALGAKESEALAEARKEAHSAEHERKRREDQEAFREELTDMAADAMDRVTETSESAMDNMSETGQAAAEDTADNVIVPNSGNGADSGDTTIVQGGGGTAGDGTADGDTDPEKVVICPACDGEVPHGDAFCLNCGAEL